MAPALVVLLLCMLLCQPASLITPTPVFTDGLVDDKNQTWACVRGPAIVRTPNNSLLAFASGAHSCADGSVGYQVLARLSHNNGSSWTDVRGVVGDYKTNGGYTAPIVDKQRGVVFLMYNHRLSEIWIINSTDNGATWGVAVNLTAVLGPLAVGPPGGVQLSNGRLVQAVHGAQGTMVLYSDDGGLSWKKGAPVVFDPKVSNGGESQVVINSQRGAEALAMIIRVGTPNVLVNHALAESEDGGMTWSNATAVQGATGPTCEGSIAALNNGSLLLTAPHWPHWHSPADRREMTVWVLNRNISGQYNVVSTNIVWPGPAAYSSLLEDGSCMLFEGGTSYRYASILFTPLTW
eukprot:m.333222 g.333222  ORF g.333222 m.333222 type:complete len:349 (+) comp17101_c0_seq1:2548-3594(+)